MQFFVRTVDRVSQVVGLSVSHFYFVCALVTAYEVIMRYVFNAPTLWGFEVVMVVCAAGWALSGAYVTLRRNHIGITVLYQYTKGRTRWWLDLFILLVSLVAMSILGYSVYGLLAESLVHLELSGTSFNSPEPTVIKALLFAGIVLYVLQVVSNLIKHFEGVGRPQSTLVEGE